MSSKKPLPTWMTLNWA